MPFGIEIDDDRLTGARGGARSTLPWVWGTAASAPDRDDIALRLPQSRA